MATYNGLPPVTMNELVKKVKESSDGALCDCWQALKHVDLNVPYSTSNPDISMLNWTKED